MHPALLLVLVPAVCFAQVQGGPRAVVEPRVFSFGQLKQNTEAVHTFKVTNAGDAPLRITGLKPSCGCTTAVMGKMALEPGEATEVEVTFHAGLWEGPVRKSITILSNDPRPEPVALVVDADVSKAASLSPPDVYFHDLGRKDHPTKAVKVEAGAPQPVHITDVELSEAPWLGVATREEEGGAFVDLDLLAKNLPPGKQAGTDTVTLHVLDSGPSTVVLKVHWDKRGLVRVTPEKVAWESAAGQPLKASLSLEQAQKRPFRITATRTSTPLLTVRELGKAVSSRKALEVVLSGAAKPGTYDEKVFLTLDTPDHPELVIRVVASLH